MYAKLAWRNIRRSLRDYSIYFLTLVFAVAIFYVFNSLADQPAFLALKGSPRRLAEAAVEAMQWLTVIMTGVVALLVLYANRAIIKKRNRELGTYLLLGMEQGRLSILLLAEITVIGMAALLVGQVGGLFLSQFFALVVNRVFAAGPTEHPFVFSPVAALRTLICYGLTFLLVGLWQAAAVYRQRLIDLIIGARKNEEIRLRSRSLSLVAGVMSTLGLGLAYWLSDRVSRAANPSPLDPRIWIGCLLGVLSTYLLFAALAGLLARVRRRQRGWLARGLNLFLYRQVTNKINTHATLLATITLMLTFTICAMSFGLALGQGLANRADKEAPFDYLLFSSSPTEDFHSVLNLFDQHGVTERRMVRFVTRSSPLVNRTLMLPQDASWFEGRGPDEFLASAQVQILPYSAYGELRAMRGYAAVDLPADGFLIHGSTAQTVPEQRARESFQRFLASGSAVTLAGRLLRPASTQLFTESLGSQLAGSEALLVVPDAVAATLPAQNSYVVLQLNGQAPEGVDQAVMDLTWDSQLRQQKNAVMVATIRAEVVGEGFMMEGTLVFLSFYIGVMFILISATLLALQQVTDAVEHRQRFQVLRKLGADEPMIDGTIARQLGIHFLTPVAVALLHSLVAMIALARVFLTGAGYTTVWPATLVTLGIFALIYGAYYLLSLQSCRALFKEPQPQ
jgi:putative ABC transport system permease protein